MTVEISSLLLAKIRSAVSAAPHLEQCGLLFGDDRRITDMSLAENIADNPARHFEINPAHLLAAHRAARAGGPEIIGHWHSHPKGSAEPSVEDARCAAGDGALWLIFAGPEARIWRAIKNGSVHGEFEPLTLAVV